LLIWQVDLDLKPCSGLVGYWFSNKVLHLGILQSLWVQYSLIEKCNKLLLLVYHLLLLILHFQVISYLNNLKACLHDTIMNRVQLYCCQWASFCWTSWWDHCLCLGCQANYGYGGIMFCMRTDMRWSGKFCMKHILFQTTRFQEWCSWTFLTTVKSWLQYVFLIESILKNFYSTKSKMLWESDWAHPKMWDTTLFQ